MIVSRTRSDTGAHVVECRLHPGDHHCAAAILGEERPCGGAHAAAVWRRTLVELSQRAGQAAWADRETAVRIGDELSNVTRSIGDHGSPAAM